MPHSEDGFKELPLMMDAMFRFGAGVDRNDRELLASALTNDVTVDFSPCGKKMNLPFGAVSGSRAIIDLLCGEKKTQITSHVVTNGRLVSDKDGPVLQMLVDATHISVANAGKRCRMMIRYDVQVELLNGQYRIEKMLIDSIWFEGDVEVLLDR